MRVALIDADILAYQAAVTSEQPYDWGEGMWTLHAFEEDAKAAFNTILNSIMEKTESKKAILAFSDSQNWRKDVLPTYKSNRAGVRKPMLLKYLRQWASTQHLTIQYPGLEGDDTIGVRATSPSIINEQGEVTICSLDKDFKTIPGKHYNFGRDEFFEISEHQADYWHMMQTLTGDSTDGYTGCPGIGPKTAEKILQAALDEGTPWANTQQLRAIYWKHVVKAFDKAGFSEEEALVQARVARILRAGEYNFNSHQVKLWTPTPEHSLA